jgi:Zn-dependent protease
MSQDVILVLFQIVVLVFALTAHAAIHAYANHRLGDPTAFMLGRVSLNPLVQLEPWGSILMPAISLFLGGALVGWGRPVPVTLRNFRKIKRDDVLASSIALFSFLGMATVALLLLIILKHVPGVGAQSVIAARFMANKVPVETSTLPPLFPLALLLYYGVIMNIVLFVFNLIPVPPLDASRLIRNYLPYAWEQTYDRIGMLGSFLMFAVAGRIIFPIFYPPLQRLFDGLLLSF